MFPTRKAVALTLMAGLLGFVVFQVTRSGPQAERELHPGAPGASSTTATTTERQLGPKSPTRQGGSNQPTTSAQARRILVQDIDGQSIPDLSAWLTPEPGDPRWIDGEVPGDPAKQPRVLIAHPDGGWRWPQGTGGFLKVSEGWALVTRLQSLPESPSTWLVTATRAKTLDLQVRDEEGRSVEGVFVHGAVQKNSLPLATRDRYRTQTPKGVDSNLQVLALERVGQSFSIYATGYYPATISDPWGSPSTVVITLKKDPGTSRFPHLVGRVLDRGQPVRGASVGIGEKFGYTQRNGEFRVPLVRDWAKHDIVVHEPTSNRVQKFLHSEVCTPHEEGLEATLALDPALPDHQLQVVYANRQPAAGLKAYMYSSARVGGMTTFVEHLGHPAGQPFLYTDSDGLLRIKRFAHQDGWLAIYYQDVLHAHLVHLHAETPPVVILPAIQPVSVEGQIVNQFGQPLSNVSLHIELRSGQSLGLLGAWQFDPIPLDASGHFGPVTLQTPFDGELTVYDRELYATVARVDLSELDATNPVLLQVPMPFPVEVQWSGQRQGSMQFWSHEAQPLLFTYRKGTFMMSARSMPSSDYSPGAEVWVPAETTEVLVVEDEQILYRQPMQWNEGAPPPIQIGP